MLVTILRSGSAQATFEADERSVFQRNVMGQHKITSEFYAPAPLPVQIGDYIEFGGKPYYINSVPDIQKVNNFTYLHTITFEAQQYRLHDKIFMDEGSMTFSYAGTASDHLNLLLTNINSLDSGWTAGTVETTEVKIISYDGATCATALGQIAEEFSLEWNVEGKVISIVPAVGNVTSLQFEYGKGKGLYSLRREALSDRNVVTRVYGFGGSKNLDYDYRDGAKRLIFGPAPYLEKNVDLYGVKEGSVTFEDIFPQRTGTVSSVDAEDIFQITDDLIGFDINEHLIEGEVATIVFKSGDLSGYEFEIVSYNHDTKTIKFNPFTEGNGYVLPNDLNKPAVGDTYTLVNIAMPFGYVTTAETKLKAKTQEYLDENSVPRVVYRLEIDEKYIRQNAVHFTAGDRIKVKDTDLGIDSLIRVAAISFPIVNPAKITATIADFVPYTRQEKIIADTIDNRKEIKVVDRTSAEQARRNTVRMRNLQDLLFDPDGYFDTGNIRPGSIETQMLSVGVGSQNFNLNGVTISPNHEGNPGKLSISAGQLIHRVIEIDGLGYIWEMTGDEFTSLDPAKHYYVYAKCSRTALTGSWEISETPVATDAIEGYYAFNLGILYAVANGYRDFAFTNGMTYIIGDQLTTGRVKDITGQNYFDLTEAKFNIGTAEEGLDWNVTEAGKLTIRGAVIADAVFADGAIIQNLNADSIKTSPSGRRIEIKSGADLTAPNSFIMYDAGGNPVVYVKDQVYNNVFGNSPGMQLVQKGSGIIPDRSTVLTGRGLFSDGGKTQWAGENTFGTIAGILKERGVNFDSPGSEISAAIVGIDDTGTGGPGENRTFAGLFDGKVSISRSASIGGGLTLGGVRHISSTYTIKGDDVMVVAWQSGITVYLPPTPELGRIVVLMRTTPGTVTVHGNGYNMGVRNSAPVLTRNMEWSEWHVFTGAEWRLINRLN